MDKKLCSARIQIKKKQSKSRVPAKHRPNVDRLARKDVVPKNHYLTLASLMTGHYPIRTVCSRGYLHPVEEFGLSLDETLLPELDNLGH